LQGFFEFWAIEEGKTGEIGTQYRLAAVWPTQKCSDAALSVLVRQQDNFPTEAILHLPGTASPQ
jgi:hypothetical protein